MSNHTATNVPVHPSDVDLAARLARAIGTMQRRMDLAARGLGLTPTQGWILAVIVRSGGVRVGDLSAAHGLNPTMVSRVVTKLEAAQLIDRLVDENDRRSVRVRATARGVALAEELRRERATTLLEALQNLEPGQRAALSEALPAFEALAAATRGRSVA
ncbi:MAG: MarR family transcriptional regulator [Acidothermus sp.]|nr:MarR family transcriptional regulator [Acidothermus sp.]